MIATQSETHGGYLCIACGGERDAARFDLDDDESYGDVLDHYLEAHHESDRLTEIVEGTWAAVECSGCGEAFASPVSTGDDRFVAEAFCAACGSHYHPLRQMVVASFGGQELIYREVDPLDPTMDVGKWNLPDKSTFDPGANQE